MLIKVTDVKKNMLPVIINLDMVREIAPLVGGGCHLFFNSIGEPVHVAEHFNIFQQFVLETVTTERIQKQVEALNPTKASTSKEKPLAIPKL